MKDNVKRVKDARVQKLSREMESITAEPNFEEISEKFKRVAKRVGLEEITEEGIMLHTALTAKQLPKGKSISVPQFFKDAGISVQRRAENEQIRKIRRKIEEILADPEFKNLSRTLKHTIAQRFDLKEFKEGGLVLQTKAPVTLGGGGGGGGTPYSYGNIYSYSFW